MVEPDRVWTRPELTLLSTSAAGAMGGCNNFATEILVGYGPFRVHPNVTLTVNQMVHCASSCFSNNGVFYQAISP